MLKVAILDDYQNFAQDFVDLKKLSGKYEIEIFNEWFESEEDAIDRLIDENEMGNLFKCLVVSNL